MCDRHQRTRRFGLGQQCSLDSWSGYCGSSVDNGYNTVEVASEFQSQIFDLSRHVSRFLTSCLFSSIGRISSLSKLSYCNLHSHSICVLPCDDFRLQHCPLPKSWKIQPKSHEKQEESHLCCLVFHWDTIFSCDF